MTHEQLVKILTLIRPGAKWNLRGDSLEWLDEEQTQPTQDEIDDALENITHLDYRALRAAEYPAIGDQLDALWKGGEAADDMHETILAVKAKYPKPQ